MEKLIRDKYPELTRKSQSPIVWRKVENIREHVSFLLKKIDEEMKEFDLAYANREVIRKQNQNLTIEFADADRDMYLEAADVLEVYDVLFPKLRKMSDIQTWQKQVHQSAAFRERLIEMGISISGVLLAQGIKREEKGSFRLGIIGIFPDTEKS